jgi:hypothetical protein
VATCDVFQDELEPVSFHPTNLTTCLQIRTPTPKTPIPSSTKAFRARADDFNLHMPGKERAEMGSEYAQDA